MKKGDRNVLIAIYSRQISLDESHLQQYTHFFVSVLISGIRQVEEAIAKAGALIEAMEYIRQFRGRTVVVKLGGSVRTGQQKL